MPRARFVKQIEQSPNHDCLIFSLHTGGLSLVPALHSKSVVHVWSPHVPAQAGTGSSLHFWPQSKGQYDEMYTLYCWAIVMVSLYAQDNRQSLVLVKLEDLDPLRLTKEMKYLLNSLTYLAWPKDGKLVTSHMSQKVPCQILYLSGLASIFWGVLCLRTWKWPWNWLFKEEERKSND